MSSFSVEPIGDGWFVVGDGTRRWRVAAAASGGTLWVFADGYLAAIDARSSSAPSRKRGRSDTGVMSPMPATVIAITAAAGQPVKQGDTLIVLEAMKMELPIRAPRDGVVKKVNCATGDLVQPDVNLLEFE